MTGAQIIETLAAMSKRNKEVYGMTVRCPECNAGIGKFCLRAGVTVHNDASDIVIHEARVVLANR